MLRNPILTVQALNVALPPIPILTAQAPCGPLAPLTVHAPCRFIPCWLVPLLLDPNPPRAWPPPLGLGLQSSDWEIAAPTEAELQGLALELGLDAFPQWF